MYFVRHNLIHGTVLIKRLGRRSCRSAGTPLGLLLGNTSDLCALDRQNVGPCHWLILKELGHSGLKKLGQSITNEESLVPLQFFCVPMLCPVHWAQRNIEARAVGSVAPRVPRRHSDKSADHGQELIGEDVDIRRLDKWLVVLIDFWVWHFHAEQLFHAIHVVLVVVSWDQDLGAANVTIGHQTVQEPAYERIHVGAGIHAGRIQAILRAEDVLELPGKRPFKLEQAVCERNILVHVSPVLMWTTVD